MQPARYDSSFLRDNPRRRNLQRFTPLDRFVSSSPSLSDLSCAAQAARIIISVQIFAPILATHRMIARSSLPENLGDRKLPQPRRNSIYVDPLEPRAPCEVTYQRFRPLSAHAGDIGGRIGITSLCRKLAGTCRRDHPPRSLDVSNY